MKVMKFFKDTWELLKESFSEFIDDNAIKLAAALSYYTIFALPPLLIIIISLCGIFFGAEAVRGEIFGQIKSLVGPESAMQIQEMIKNVRMSGDNILAVIIGAVTLFMGASGVFLEIQDSINFIWGLKAKPKKGFITYLRHRLMSFSMIGSIGFLLLVGLVVNAAMDLISSRLISTFPQITVYVFYVLNLIMVFAIITLLFFLIYNILPDGRMFWKDSLIGASFTSLLFMIGKFAIGAYLGRSTIASTYGAAGSVVLILVWVYYSAIILYFGAEFTKVYSLKRGKNITPKSFAVKIKKANPEITPAEANVKK